MVIHASQHHSFNVFGTYQEIKEEEIKSSNLNVLKKVAANQS